MEKTTTTNAATTPIQRILRAFLIYLCSAVCIVAAAVLKFLFLENIKTSFTAVSYILFAVMLAVILLGHFIYVACSRSVLLATPKLLAAIYTALTVSVIACIYLELLNVLFMPCLLAALIVATLSHGRDAFAANLFSNVLVFFILMTQNYFAAASNYHGIVAMFAQGLVGGTIVSYWISNDARRLNFLCKGLIVSVLSIGIVFATTTAFGVRKYALSEVAFLIGGTLGQVVVAVILQPVFETVFNIVTNTRLVELTDHSAPLIKRLREEAPGTFSHCLAVANFAEMCASAIGENPYLARACAYYHDVGKLMNPQYYKENQGDTNPHDGLLPEVSAELIRSHTVNGKKLCEQYHIPREISDITVQHHGTLPIYIFYVKAQQLTDGEVDLADYSYHGHTPVSKIAAIIMLCDSSEAAIRAMDNPNAERVDKLLRSIISARIEGGQFDDCDITMRDLDVIRQTIMDAYGGHFHKRLRYPDGGNGK